MFQRLLESNEIRSQLSDLESVNANTTQQKNKFADKKITDWQFGLLLTFDSFDRSLTETKP